MDRTQAQRVIESHMGLDDSEITLALEALGFQALSTEALELIAQSQMARAETIRATQKPLFPIYKRRDRLEQRKP